MTKRDTRRRGLSACLLGLALFLVGCSNSNGQNSLDPHGKSARTVNNLFVPVAFVAVAIGALVLFGVVYGAIRYRARPGNENPRQVHGNTPLEIGWTIIPALILLVVAVPTVTTIFKLAKEPSGKPLRAVVTGKQWWWQVEYPHQKVVTANELHMIAGRPLRLELVSDNVIHSFWIPELAGKQDVVPGRTNKITLFADKPGRYYGQCAQYCGLSHANMRMRVIAQTQADFDTWIAGQQRGPAQPYTGKIAELTGAKYQCVNCHVFDDASKKPYGPNLTHVDSREAFAGDTYTLDHDNLLRWVTDAPSLVPMQSKECRLPPPATCVGMPSFTKNTPKGQPAMTRGDAEFIVRYLLGEQ